MAKVWLPIALFGVLWADLIRQLSYTWETSEQYAYGWFVPFLALALFWRRWMTRPAARPQASPLWLVALVVVAAAILLPVRVVYEINPDWALCSWLMTLIVVGISLYAVFLAGGWKWVRHFAFPVCFILVAVPWPYRIEHGLTQRLMRVVAGLTVELLGWLNIPALQHGNLIEVSTGVVGVDEACSGIRSFQSTLMAALFLGELYRLRRTRRLLLLAGGVVMASCFNVVRTFVLSWRASTAGIAALEKWHDPAGLMIFLVSFVCLWVIAVWLRAKLDLLSLLRNSQPSTLNPQRSPSTPRGFLTAVGCWSLCVLALTETWYRSHEIKDMGVFRWSVTLPETNPTFQKIELAPRSVKLLAYDYGTTGRWLEEGGVEWSVSFFRWDPRSVESVMRARVHRPDVCLPASGFRKISDSGLAEFNSGDLKLPFRRYIYESGGQTIYVFFCQWEDGSEKQAGSKASEQAGRLQSVLTGRRFLGQQTLELVLAGCESLQQAERAVRSRLPLIIKLENPAHRVEAGSALAVSNHHQVHDARFTVQ